MNRLLLAAATACVFAAPALAAPLEVLLAGDNAWSQGQEDFMSAAKKYGYEWTSNAHDSARTALQRRSQGAVNADMTVFSLPVIESVARFDGGKLSGLTMMLYARGDLGDWPELQFNALVHSAADALNTKTGVKFTVREKNAANAMKPDGLVWATDRARFVLEYSKTRDARSGAIRPEYVRLEITPPGTSVSLLSSAANLQRARFSGLTHVKRNGATGDVWLGDVPMVDQGQKGYCVVAATERVMRYYGDHVDENQLAQVANTSSEAGTSSDVMIDALKKVGVILKFRVREVEKFDIRGILKLMADYNRAAKRAGKHQLDDPGHMIDVNAIYAEMDPDALRDARAKDETGLHRFQREAQTHIDQGIPLLWMVMLGKMPEPGIPQNAGGHMRLIIGYNTTKNEILFSDSWGAGHELKRMPLESAWAMTTGLVSIEPLN